MVDLLELCLLRLLNEKNLGKPLDFTVKAFSALSDCNWLTIKELSETTELDQETIAPIVKTLAKQRIIVNNCGRLSINKRLHSINRMIEK